MRVVSFPERTLLVEGAAVEIAAALRRATDRRVNLGLAGGSTPKPIYERLREEPVPWDRVDLWLSDERWVPPQDPDSNGRMAAEALANHVPAAFHRPRWSPYLEASDAAAHYESVLRSLMPDDRADVVLLGMGDDGHTASLFSGTPALAAPEFRWYVANWVEKLGSWRLTSTPRFLRRAHQLMVIVSGASKAAVLAEVLEGPPGRYPIQLLHEAEGEVTWLIDDDAAANLSTTEVERPA